MIHAVYVIRVEVSEIVFSLGKKDYQPKEIEVEFPELSQAKETLLKLLALMDAQEYEALNLMIWEVFKYASDFVYSIDSRIYTRITIEREIERVVLP